MQDFVLREVVLRERFEEYHKTVFLGKVLGAIFGIDSRVLRSLEESLELAVYQTAYDPEEIRMYMEKARAQAAEERERRLRDARLLAQVASYSEDADAKDSDSVFLNTLSYTRATPPAAAGPTDPWKKR